MTSKEFLDAIKGKTITNIFLKSTFKLVDKSWLVYVILFIVKNKAHSANTRVRFPPPPL